MSKKKTVTPAKPVKVVVKKDYTRLWEILAILLVCFAVYGNSIRNGYNLDDAYVVSLDASNPQTAMGIKGIPEILTSPYNVGEGVTYGYRPLGKVTMAIEYSLWGNNPHYSHVVNILLYALNIFLLLLFIRKIANMFNYRNEFVIYASLLLFAVHPIHTEVVNSIKNREEILCFIFMLSALLLFFKYYEERKHILIIPIAFFTLLSFLSKQTAVNIFGIIALYIVFRDGKKMITLVNDIVVWFRRLLAVFKQPTLIATKYFVAPLSLILLFSLCVNWILPATSLPTIFGILCLVIFLVWIVIWLYGRRLELQKFSLVKLYKPFLWFMWISINYLSLSRSMQVQDTWIQLFLQVIVFNYTPAYIILIVSRIYSRQIVLPAFLRSVIPALSVVVIVAILGIIAFMVVEKAPIQVQEAYFSERIEHAYEQNPYAFDLAGKDLFPTGMQTLFFYLNKLALPYPLGFYYGYDMLPVQDWKSLFPYLGIILLLCISVLSLLSVKYAKYRFHIFWILILFGCLLPFLNLLEKHLVTGIVGERLAYQASLGYCVLLALLTYTIAESGHNKIANFRHWTVAKAATVLLIFICLPYAALTLNRNTKWVDNTTLFQNDIRHLSHSARANFMVASNYMLSLEKAKPGTVDRDAQLNMVNNYLNKALTVYPQYDAALLAKGLLYFEQYRQPDSAMVILGKVSNRRTIDDARAKELMGDINYLVYQDKQAAFSYYSLGYELRPQSLELYNKVMQVLFELEDFGKVQSYAEIAIGQGWHQGYIDRADANFYTGNIPAAISDYEAAIRAGVRTDALINKLVTVYRQTNDTVRLNWLKGVLSY